jgi:hypothetical protein
MKIRIWKQELLEGDVQTDRQADRKLDMTEITVIFRNSVNAHKNKKNHIYYISYIYIYLSIYLFMKKEFILMEKCSSLTIYFFTIIRSVIASAN